VQLQFASRSKYTNYWKHVYLVIAGMLLQLERCSAQRIRGRFFLAKQAPLALAREHSM
jgi:hypothetical protein